MPKFINGVAVQNDMSQKNSVEVYTWSLKKAASRARELAEAQQNPAWLQVAKLLDGMREKGLELARMKAMRGTDVDSAIDRIKSRMVGNG